MGPPHQPVEVALLHWPREEARRRELARNGVPRLLLVPETAPPPQVDDDEDWARLPADERDVAIRAANLWLRCGGDRSVTAPAVPTMALPAAEAVVFERLVEVWPAVLARDDLAAAVWPAGPPSTRALDDVVYRLRRRLRVAGLEVVASRGRGFALRPMAREPEEVTAGELTAGVAPTGDRTAGVSRRRGPRPGRWTHPGRARHERRRPVRRTAGRVVVPLALLALLVVLVCASVPTGWWPADGAAPTLGAGRAVHGADRPVTVTGPVEIDGAVTVAGPVEIDPAVTDPPAPLTASVRVGVDARRPPRGPVPAANVTLAPGARAPIGLSVTVIGIHLADDLQVAPLPLSGGTRGPPPR